MGVIVNSVNDAGCNIGLSQVPKAQFGPHIRPNLTEIIEDIALKNINNGY